MNDAIASVFVGWNRELWERVCGLQYLAWARRIWPLSCVGRHVTSICKSSCNNIHSSLIYKEYLHRCWPIITFILTCNQFFVAQLLQLIRKKDKERKKERRKKDNSLSKSHKHMLPQQISKRCHSSCRLHCLKIIFLNSLTDWAGLFLSKCLNLPWSRTQIIQNDCHRCHATTVCLMFEISKLFSNDVLSKGIR